MLYAVSFALAAALLAGSRLYLLLPLLKFRRSSSTSLVAKRYWLSLPLVSGIMLLWLASIYRQMLTLGSRRSDCSFLDLAMFMMKCEFSCQSLELISHLVQPVCLNNSEEDAAFLYPTNCRYFSTHPFHSYFWTKHPHLLFPLQS